MEITYPFGDSVNFVIQEIAISVEVPVPKRPLSNDFIRNFAFHLHEEL